MSVSAEKQDFSSYISSDISAYSLRKYGLVVHLNLKVKGNFSVDVGCRIARVTAFRRCCLL